jgi:hypothetical protein
VIGRVLVLVMACQLALGARARAEDLVAYQTDGVAPAASADARMMALDEAFGRAAASALADLVSPDVRAARKAELDREIVGRARLWVNKFTVTRDDTHEGRRELAVSVRIDRDKIRARLTELGVATRDAGGEAPDGVPGEPAARTATVLLRVATPAGVRAGYGQNADKDVPGLATLTKRLRDAGFAMRRAPATGPAARAEGTLPLGDDEADALADAAKADVVAIAGVTVGDRVPVRGQSIEAQLVTAHVRVVDRKDGKAVGQATAIAAVRTGDPDHAIERALLAAAGDVLPPVPTRLAVGGAFFGDDTPIAEPGVVLVRLPARTPFSLVLAEQRYLSGAKGVRAASLRRLSPAGWVIGVVTKESIDQIARIAKKPPATDTHAAVKIVGEVIEVTLSGAP